MVDDEGRIVVPFVGSLPVAGMSPKQVERQITGRLAGMAHQPQVLVQLSRNSNTTVTVVGEVANTTRVPLTPRGERLLDILASAGGTRQPVGKMTIQITRGTQITSMPLERVIRDPQQNVRLQAGDIVTALFQPYSFTALGATGRNEELPFEATGLTLSQALGRVNGLQDARANAKGVFIFRFEDPANLSPEQRSRVVLTPDGKAPIIYQVDLRDPHSLFIAQNFPMRDKDVLYIANAPLADIQKFVNVIYSSILPAATAATVIP
jgi:polysaccharide export outer membrane protein